MMLACGMSNRILPSLAFHMRDEDWIAWLLPAALVLVVQSEQEGGVDGGVGELGVTTARVYHGNVAGEQPTIRFSRARLTGSIW